MTTSAFYLEHHQYFDILKDCRTPICTPLEQWGRQFAELLADEDSCLSPDWQKSAFWICLAQRMKDKSGNNENLCGIEFGCETNLNCKTQKNRNFLHIFCENHGCFRSKCTPQPSPFCKPPFPGDAYSNDMELATMLSNLRVPAPKQLPRDDLVKDDPATFVLFLWRGIILVNMFKNKYVISYDIINIYIYNIQIYIMDYDHNMIYVVWRFPTMGIPR